MNFVDGYGSDSDDGSVVNVASKPTAVKSVPQSAPVPAPSLPAAVANQQRTAAVATAVKKVKKLDISFLPPEIQAALARGDSMRDSDDEDDVKRLPKAKMNYVVADDPASSVLLGMLPAPKSKDGSYNDTGDSKVAPKVQPTNDTIGNTSAKDDKSTKAAAPKSAFSFGYTTVEKTKSGAAKAAQTTSETETAASAGSRKSSGEVEEKSTVLPWFQDTAPRPSAFAPAPAASKVSYSAYTSSALGVSSSGYGGMLGASAYGSETAEPASAPVQPRQLSYEEYQRQNQLLQQQQEEQELPAHKKRKDRDFELQLMSGDLSGLQHAPVQDITVQHQWNELAYTEQQQREQEVQRGFGIGVNKNLMQVSKQQSRKHQLSSLAMKAAETELAMLEKRGNRNLTKSETQGKYGW